MIDIDALGVPVWLPSLPPTAATLVSPNLQPLPVIPVIGVALAIWYIAAFVTVRRAGKRWPLMRAISFIAGCGLLVFVTGSAIEGYGFVLNSVFMFQQLTMMMVIPVFLVLGSPGRLLLRVPMRGRLSRIARAAALRGLRSRWAKVVLHPGLLLPVYLVSFYGVYLAGLGTALVATWAGHLALELYFLGAGILITIPIASADLLPSKQSPVAKLLSVLAEVPLHATFGVIVMLSTSPLLITAFVPPSEWGIDPLNDLRVAGALAWTYGELPALIVVVVMLSRWERDDTRRARAADRKKDQVGDIELETYNAYLQGLSRRPAAPPLLREENNPATTTTHKEKD